jgi:hypothetical protein
MSRRYDLINWLHWQVVDLGGSMRKHWRLFKPTSCTYTMFTGYGGHPCMQQLQA